MSGDRCTVADVELTTGAEYVRESDEWGDVYAVVCPRCGDAIRPAISGGFQHDDVCRCGLRWTVEVPAPIATGIGSDVTSPTEARCDPCWAGARPHSGRLHLTEDGKTTLCGKAARWRCVEPDAWKTAGWRGEPASRCEACARAAR